MNDSRHSDNLSPAGFLDVPNTSARSSCSTLVTKYPRKIDPFDFSKMTLPYQRTPIIDDFSIGKLLGRGASGAVYKAQDKTTEKYFALKVIRKKESDPQTIQFIIKEQEALRKVLGNNSFIQLAASFHDTINYYLVTVSGVCRVDFYMCG